MENVSNPSEQPFRRATLRLAVLCLVLFHNGRRHCLVFPFPRFVFLSFLCWHSKVFYCFSPVSLMQPFVVSRTFLATNLQVTPSKPLVQPDPFKLCPLPLQPSPDPLPPPLVVHILFCSTNRCFVLLVCLPAVVFIVFIPISL